MAGATAIDLALLLLRIAAGGFLLPHALGKLFGWFGGPGLSGFAEELRGFGLPVAAPVPLLLATVQMLSGLAVVLGWQTRIAACVAAAFLFSTALLALPKGWFWMRGGVEYPLFWTVALCAIALAGPGGLGLQSVSYGASLA
ncbi:DoxX family protein [Stenotrophomonas sp.]|uniref:DoxX family protein n=1 Tax=Stenotrophomonas sp. TaxID=69392 RepID=UPI0029B50227|nr:DoxX family protein [Stenotrophomonas sp.]MDX3934054.1 DoxX family protein [Stenotrophomonas sp.]